MSNEFRFKKNSNGRVAISLAPGQQLVEGEVKWWNVEKGWGFLVNPDASPQAERADIFVHHSVIEGLPGFRNLTPGQRVQYVAEKTDRGLQAVRVVVPE